MANQIDNIQLLDGLTGLLRSVDPSNDDLFLSVDLTLQAGGVFQSDNIKRGTADPNVALVAGNEGDIYQRTLGATGQLYINEDGTPTGWHLLIASGSPGQATLGVLRIRAGVITVFATITLALTGALAGDLILVGPGSYAESFTIPADVQVRSAYGPQQTKITGVLATGIRVTLSDNAVLFGFDVTLPTDANPAISYAGTGIAAAVSCYLTGNGASGIGIQNSSTGRLLLYRITYETGACDAVFVATNGTVEGDTLLLQGGSCVDILRISGGSLVVINNLNSYGLVTVSGDAVQVGDGSGVLSNVIVESTTTAIHFTNNAASLDLRVFRFVVSTNWLLVDGGLTEGTLFAQGGRIDSGSFNTPAGWFATASVEVACQFDDESLQDPALVNTSDLLTGFFESGSVSALGEGGPTSRGMVVLTTDNTASAVSDGGNFIDVSVAAGSPSGSTFSFQGTAINHTFLVGSTLTDGSALLRHFNWLISQTTASTTDGAYVFEVWDGANWTEVGVMDISLVEGYRYADVVFIRPNSFEVHRFGIDQTTTWATKTINGTNAYWLRCRIATAPTTAPVFERLLISRSSTFVSEEGQLQQTGLAQFRQTFSAAGNIFGESGGVSSTTVPVGTGGLPTGWDHSIKNSQLNGSGDAIYFQFVLPRGICTAFPLNFEVVYSSSVVTTGASFIMSILPKEVSGVLVAEPTGGITPTPRTVGATPTLTAVAAQTNTQAPPSTVINTLHQVQFNGFDVSSFYEGDLVFIRFELDNDGTPNADFIVYALEISGVRWTQGTRLE